MLQQKPLAYARCLGVSQGVLRDVSCFEFKCGLKLKTKLCGEDKWINDFGGMSCGMRCGT